MNGGGRIRLDMRVERALEAQHRGDAASEIQWAGGQVKRAADGSGVVAVEVDTKDIGASRAGSRIRVPVQWPTGPGGNAKRPFTLPGPAWIGVERKKVN